MDVVPLLVVDSEEFPFVVVVDSVTKEGVVVVLKVSVVVVEGCDVELDMRAASVVVVVVREIPIFKVVAGSKSRIAKRMIASTPLHFDAIFGEVLQDDH